MINTLSDKQLALPVDAIFDASVYACRLNGKEWDALWGNMEVYFYRAKYIVEDGRGVVRSDPKHDARYTLSYDRHWNRYLFMAMFATSSEAVTAKKLACNAHYGAFRDDSMTFSEKDARMTICVPACGFGVLHSIFCAVYPVLAATLKE